MYRGASSCILAESSGTSTSGSVDRGSREPLITHACDAGDAGDAGEACDTGYAGDTGDTGDAGDAGDAGISHPFAFSHFCSQTIPRLARSPEAGIQSAD